MRCSSVVDVSANDGLPPELHRIATGKQDGGVTRCWDGLHWVSADKHCNVTFGSRPTQSYNPVLMLLVQQQVQQQQEHQRQKWAKTSVD